jgi:hypothetical protein
MISYPMRTSLLKIIAVSVAALTVALCAVFLYIQVFRYFCGNTLTIEMRTPATGQGQVFFDTGDSYQDDERYRFDIRPTSVFEKYTLSLPKSSVRAVRFDPVDNMGIFEIKSITIKTRGEKVIWEGDRLAQRIVPQQQIEMISTKAVFVGSSIGEDPIFIVEGLVIPDHHDPFPQTLLYIVLFATSMTLLGLILYRLIHVLLRLCHPYLPKGGILFNFRKSMVSLTKPLYISIRELAGPMDGLKRLWDLRWVRYAGLLFFLILWGRVVWSIYSETGLFRWIGTDFALYFAQSTVLWSGEPGAIYRPEVFNEIFQRLIMLYSPDRSAVHPTHVPYLPLFAWLFTPFTLSSPLVGFVLWESLQLLAVICLAWRVTQLFPGLKKTWVTLVLLVSFPVASTLIVGQPQLLLAGAVAECYLSLKKGRDFTAGLWLALLLFKPQYGLLIGLVLIWKRRWAAIAGVIVGGMVIVGGSVLVAGVPTLMAYPKAFADMAVFRSWDAAHMINWRSMVLALLPGIGEQKGMMLTLSLAYVTVFLTALAWRGAWLPHDSRFPARFTLLLLATLLANHHSFNYGAVILILPLAAILAEGRRDRFIAFSAIAGVFLPTLSLTLVNFHDMFLASRILTFSLLLLYAGLLLWVWRHGESLAENQSPLSKLKIENKLAV